jgi:hypothetical protein
MPIENSVKSLGNIEMKCHEFGQKSTSKVWVRCRGRGGNSMNCIESQREFDPVRGGTRNSCREHGLNTKSTNTLGLFD